MPSRVIRGEINSSDSLSRVSMEADLTFRALLVAVDDYGRMDARPAVLKAALFPTRDSVTPKRIMGWIKELAQEGCIVLYEVEDRPYLALPGWERHRSNAKRAKSSRFPQPPEIIDAPGIRGNPGDSRGSARLTSCEGSVASSGLGSESAHGRTPRAPRSGTSLCPDPLSPESMERLETWRSTRDFSAAQVAHAIEVVRDWSRGNGKKRVDWVLVIQNAMRDGWALKGFTGPGRAPPRPPNWAEQQSEDNARFWEEYDREQQQRKQGAIGAPDTVRVLPVGRNRSSA